MLRVLAVGAILFFCAGFTVPALNGPVMDLARMISVDDEAKIENLIRTANGRGSVQLQVLTVPSLEGEPIEQASIKITDQYKLGTASKDNGVLFLISRNDREMRIEVGQGLEGVIPDAYANRIIQDVMVPLFREGAVSAGILTGVSEIIRLADPEMAQTGSEQRGRTRTYGRSRGGSNWIFILVMILFFFFFGGGGRRRSFLSGVLLGGGLGGRSGGFGGGGGGSWGGGGGGFSGGGASGRW